MLPILRNKLMRSMKKWLIPIQTLLTIVALIAIGCARAPSELTEETGVLLLHLSDSPIDADNVAGVFITITEIQYEQNGEWLTFEDFDGPQIHDLLELSGESSALLDELELPAGQYSQIRFVLDIPEEGTDPPADPGCYILFADESIKPLFITTGGSSSFEAIGQFEIYANGRSDITADFEVRNAVYLTGDGQNQRYIFNPTIRLVVTHQSGNIGGMITNGSSYTDVIIYVYDAGTWDDSEDDDPEDQEFRFPNAVTSVKMDEEGNYILALLPTGTYDLVVTGFNDHIFGEVLDFISDVEVHTGYDVENPGDPTTIRHIEIP